MNRTHIIIITISLCSSLVSCRTTADSIPLNTQPGFTVVTEKQKDLVKEARQLTRGMSKEAVKGKLGGPTEEEPHNLNYMVVENSSGGHYVEAKLFFDDNGLARVELGSGDVLILRQE